MLPPPYPAPVEKEVAMSDQSKGEGLQQAVKIATTMVQAMKMLGKYDRALGLDSWKLIEALTKDPRDFPKAVLIGTVDTDVATIRIDGLTSEPIQIQTGADGTYSVYGDNYSDDGLPGRIIIEIQHPVSARTGSEAGE